jgi:hypothetical protein
VVVSPDLVTQYIAVIDGQLVEYLLAKQIKIHTKASLLLESLGR